MTEQSGFHITKSDRSLIYMHGLMCHRECIVFFPVSCDGGEGKNKSPLCFLSIFCNHSEACRFEEAVEGCLSGTTAVIILLWQCRRVVDLRELPWQNEQRVWDAWGSLSIMWNPFVEQYWTESHPDISSLMCLLIPLFFIYAKWQWWAYLWYDRHESFTLCPWAVINR